jgi:hypothetical protein
MMHMERCMSVSAVSCERKSCRDKSRRLDVYWKELRNLQWKVLSLKLCLTARTAQM